LHFSQTKIPESKYPDKQGQILLATVSSLLNVLTKLQERQLSKLGPSQVLQVLSQLIQFKLPTSPNPLLQGQGPPKGVDSSFLLD